MSALRCMATGDDLGACGALAVAQCIVAAGPALCLCARHLASHGPCLGTIVRLPGHGEGERNAAFRGRVDGAGGARD